MILAAEWELTPAPQLDDVHNQQGDQGYPQKRGHDNRNHGFGGYPMTMGTTNMTRGYPMNMLPSGKRLHNYGKSPPCFMEKFTN